VKGVGGTGYLSGITAIAPGWYHALAQASDGTVYGWGENTYGQLGNNATASSQATPVKMLLPCNVAPPVQGQCQLAPVCLPTGVWSLPNVADGTSCNDGNACTDDDVCTSGVCAGTPYTCAPPGLCQEAGTCNGDGTCSYANQPDGTTCNDGNACMQTELCEAGACVESNPVVCMPSDACHEAGTCDPSTGTCSNPTAPDGTACTGEACTADDTCLAGVCTAGSYPCADALEACDNAAEGILDSCVVACDGGETCIDGCQAAESTANSQCLTDYQTCETACGGS
jgi:hypothetical protein